MTLSSSLDAVTIYREGAVCLRRATSEVPARQLRIGGLPLSADPGSLRARITAGSARVLDIRPQFDVQVLEEVDVPVEQKAREAAAELHQKLQLRKNRLASEIAELTNLRPRFLEQRRGDPPREAPVNSMIALMEFTDAELGARLEQRRALDLELEDARRELEVRTARLAEASSARRTERARLSRVAVVTLSELPTGPIELTIEYQVPGVRWVPNYQLKLERGLGSGTLLLRASIAQNTGEDWSNVELSLSTASLARRTEVPELKAMKIGRRQAAPARSGWREPPPGLSELFAAYDGATVRVVPPPPPPMPPSAPMQELMRGGPQKKLANKPMAPGGGGPPMPPAMAMPAPMVSRAMAAPSASRGPPVGKAAGVVGMASAIFAGAPQSMDRRRMEKEDASEAAVDSMAPMEDLAADGFGGLAPEELDEGGAPQSSGPDAALLDYSRLVMPGVQSSSRGKLQPVDRWDSMFVAGVSVQVDVVMVAINRARQAANEVQSIPLPALCNPVHALDSFDYRYDCEARADVPSNGKWTSVAVTTCAVGFTPEYVCVPSVEQKVYRTLQITNRGAHALLPGPVDVTAGEEFLMTTRLPAIPPRNELPYRLGLGVEEAIKVSRKTSFKETAGGFLGGSTVLPHDLEIELNNRLATPALIEVRERVPWVDPEDEKDVKVEEPQVTPVWEKMEKPIDGEGVVRGARRWRVTVPGGQSMKLVAQFTIRIPSDRMVVGGNRRT